MMDPNIDESTLNKAIGEIEKIDSYIEKNGFNNNEIEHKECEFNDELDKICTKLKNYDSELYRLLYEINDNDSAVYDYISETKNEILEQKNIRKYKIKEYFALFNDDSYIIELLTNLDK